MSDAEPDYFERLYRSDPDPWRFASSAYERAKYAATLATLPRARFSRCFEVGCSIGVLTRQLAVRCDTVLGVDVSETALAHARARCEDLPHVALDWMAVPEAWPEGTFDLIVFSEVLYYLGLPGIRQAAERTADNLMPGGAVVLVNWLGATGGACTGDEAAALFIEAVRGRLRVTAAERAERYRVDVLG
jgi:cyclopropane fatty-acyl-phospholipid synthase-like methyltransferase